MDEEKKFDSEDKRDQGSDMRGIDENKDKNANPITSQEKSDINKSTKKTLPVILIVCIIVSISICLSIIFVAFLLGGLSNNADNYELAHFHEYSEWEITQEPTCVLNGSQSKKCSCGDVVSEVLYATGHNYGAWITTKEATCLESGKETRSCKNCAKDEVKTLSSLGHSYTHGKCSRCNNISDAYDALAYYIYTKGTRSSDGEYYIATTYEKNYFCIYTDSRGKELSFRLLAYSSDSSSSAYVSMDLEKGLSSQTVYMLWENDYYCEGTININTFNKNTRYISSFYTDCPYTSLKSSLKELMGSEVSLLFIGSNLLILLETDLDITMADLGVKNYN